MKLKVFLYTATLFFFGVSIYNYSLYPSRTLAGGKQGHGKSNGRMIERDLNPGRRWSFQEQGPSIEALSEWFRLRQLQREGTLLDYRLFSMREIYSLYGKRIRLDEPYPLQPMDSFEVWSSYYGFVQRIPVRFRGRETAEGVPLYLRKTGLFEVLSRFQVWTVSGKRYRIYNIGGTIKQNERTVNDIDTLFRESQKHGPTNVDIIPTEERDRATRFIVSARRASNEILYLVVPEKPLFCQAI